MLEIREAAWREAKSPVERIDAANRLAQVLAQTDVGRCRELAEETYEAARALGYLPGEAGALRYRAICRLIQADLEGAEADYRTALALSREQGLREIEASCFLGLSTLQRKATNYAEAMALLLEARRLRQDEGDQQGEVAVLNNLGALCLELGSYDEALAFLLAGLKMARDNQLADYEIFCLANVAGIKREVGDLEGAAADLSFCLALAKTLGNNYIRPHLLAALCEVYLKGGRIEEALRVNEEALTLASGGEDRQVELSLLVHLGTICNELGMPEAAEAAFTRALERTERLGDLERRLETLCQAAVFYQSQERLPEARRTFHEVLEQANQTGARRHLPRVLRGLAAVEPEQAHHYQEQADAIEAVLKQQALKSRQLALEALG